MLDSHAVVTGKHRTSACSFDDVSVVVAAPKLEDELGDRRFEEECVEDGHLRDERDPAALLEPSDDAREARGEWRVATVAIAADGGPRREPRFETVTELHRIQAARANRSSNVLRFEGHREQMLGFGRVVTAPSRVDAREIDAAGQLPHHWLARGYASRFGHGTRRRSQVRHSWRWSMARRAIDRRRAPEGRSHGPPLIHRNRELMMV